MSIPAFAMPGCGICFGMACGTGKRVNRRFRQMSDEENNTPDKPFDSRAAIVLFAIAILSKAFVYLYMPILVLTDLLRTLTPWSFLVRGTVATVTLLSLLMVFFWIRFRRDQQVSIHFDQGVSPTLFFVVMLTIYYLNRLIQ